MNQTDIGQMNLLSNDVIRYSINNVPELHIDHAFYDNPLSHKSICVHSAVIKALRSHTLEKKSLKFINLF